MVTVFVRVVGAAGFGGRVNEGHELTTLLLRLVGAEQFRGGS
jgi:hypothetical protein